MAFCDVVGAPASETVRRATAPLLRHLAPAPSHARQQTPEPSRSKSGCCFTEMLRTQLLRIQGGEQLVIYFLVNWRVILPRTDSAEGSGGIVIVKTPLPRSKRERAAPSTPASSSPRK